MTEEAIEVVEIGPVFANGVVEDIGNRVTVMNKEEQLFSARTIVELVGWIHSQMWSKWNDDPTLPKDRSPSPTIRDVLQRFDTEQLVTIRSLVGGVNWLVTECGSVTRRDAKAIKTVIDSVMVEK